MNIPIPYEDYASLQRAGADRENIRSILLSPNFTDDKSKVDAIKAILQLDIDPNAPSGDLSDDSINDIVDGAFTNESTNTGDSGTSMDDEINDMINDAFK